MQIAAYLQHIDDRFAAGEDYAKVGKVAAFPCQFQSLDLVPWQSPPCYADMTALDQPYGESGGARESAELALRMQRQGVNRWHPDPARECERIEAERARMQDAK